MEIIKSESFFVDCENLPKVMKAALDKPWTHHEVVVHKDRAIPPWICVACCMRGHDGYVKVTLERHLFCDGLRKAVVWFGECPECHKVHWAKSELG